MIAHEAAQGLDLTAVPLPAHEVPATTPAADAAAPDGTDAEDAAS